MEEFFKSPTVLTVAAGLVGQVFGYLLIIKRVEQHQIYQDEKIKTLGNSLKAESDAREKSIQELKIDFHRGDTALWEIVNEIKRSLMGMVQTLTRVETKIEMQNKEK